MSVPYTFSTASQSIPLAQLDSNFATPITLGQSTAFLGQTVTTITGLTLANVNITSGNVVANASGNITFGNTTVGLGNSSSSIGNLTLNNTTINSGSIASGVTAITQAAAANNTAIATTQFVTTAVTSAVPNSYNTVGTYAMGKISGSTSNPFTVGTTYAAATLGIPSGSGTWRFMGYGTFEQNNCGTYSNTMLAIRTA